MFERYTERGRRILFFARYEASQLGSLSIEAHHLLLGLIREGRGLTARIFAEAEVSLPELRREIEQNLPRERRWVPTSVEIPFSADTKRALQAAAGEAERLRHDYIGPEHLRLGLLRIDESPVATPLTAKGLGLTAARAAVLRT